MRRHVPVQRGIVADIAAFRGVRKNAGFVRRIAAALAATLATALAAAPAAAAYPDRPIHFIVPYPPGGGTDVVARLVAEKLQTMWNAQIVVENRAGADTQIGTRAVAQAAPDGYTFGFITPTFAINKTLYPNLPFDPAKDFAAVSMLATSPMFLVVGAQTKARTVAELVALAKANPDRTNYSSSSSITYVNGEMFKQAAGIAALNIPYKGSAPSVTAVAGGQVTYTLDTLLATKGLVQGGMLRVLAVSSRERAPQLPDVPTMEEAGIKGFTLTFWYGMVAPAATPADIVRKMNEAVREVLKQPEVRKVLESLGTEAAYTTPSAFAEALRDDIARYGDVIRANHLQPAS